jgi:(1->4)-alpha-D-glucan 1-alpha-D-glucosylmutase
MKFQQVTAAVMAKGVEDTAFYRYHRLVSLNEVGGNPTHFGTTAEEFHRANDERLSCWPDSMLSSSTHDSKRSEDVRARINVLSEIPLVWLLHLRRWRDWNRSKKHLIDGHPAPTRNDEYVLYQTLIGTWPFRELDDNGWKAYTERIQQYMLKAAREAKEHTSWANTNSEYESALVDFTRALLYRSAPNRFIADFETFAHRIARVGVFNSLSQTLLKLTSPGVPDIYQGNELLELTLVDPDNRRSVDYNHRSELFETLRHGTVPGPDLLARVRDLLSTCSGSAAKLYLTSKTLTFRQQQPGVFRRGSYVPLRSQGEKSEHVIAFARQHEGRTIVIAVPRLCARLMGERYESVCEEEIWSNSTIELPSDAASCYHNLFTLECLRVKKDEGSYIELSEVFRNFPVALLVSELQESDQNCGPETQA